jgi:acyl-CoA thioesterase-1
VPLSDTNTLWLFGGDSITQGARHTHGARSFVQLFEEELRYRRHRTSELVVNAAVDGSTVESGSEALSEWLERLVPAWVCLMYGTNDAKQTGTKTADPVQFAQALGALVGRAQGLGSLVAIATPPPARGEQARTERARLPEFVDATRSVARDTGAVLIDHAAAWQGAPLDVLMDDDIHPNAAGHERLATTLLEAVAPWLR